jgi:hypothetical protein
MAPDYRDASHLPKQRPSGRPPDPAGLPRQRRGTTPQMIGRYPDFDVLEQSGHWDAPTRDVVLGRVAEPGPLRFFDEEAAVTLRAFCDTVTAQDEPPRIPVLEQVDANLADGRLPGFRYADMPDDGDTWRLAARGLDEAARAHGAASFGAATVDARIEICSRLKTGELSGGTWERLNPSRTWAVLMRDALGAFYAHPWAWNEIGFSGPAYPRGYSRLGIGLSETWEGEEAFELDPVEDVRRRGVER